jgi:hypothetical protein
MAREYINTSTGLVPIGDTQGLLVPKMMRYCKLEQDGAHTASNLPVSFKHQSGENWLLDKTEVKAPEDGLYLLTASCVFQDTDVPRTVLQFTLNGASMPEGILTDVGAHTTAVGSFLSTQAVLLLHVEDRVKMYAATDSSVVDVAASRLSMVLLQQQVPYIIANKGALVSGGAFQFDEDGNGYTENYSTGEVRCGTWIDGKPLYKQTVLFTGTWPYTSGLGVKLLDSFAPIEHLVNSEVYYKNSANPLVRGCFEATVYINDSGGGIYVGSPSFSSGAGNYYMTVWYTKTTD